MALPINTFRPSRYLRSKFREGKYLLAAEATDIQLESLEQLRDYIKKTYGDIAVGIAFQVDQISADLLRLRPGEAWIDGIPFALKSGSDARVFEGVVETGVSVVDFNATTVDVGGKNIDLSGGLADGSYSVVVSAFEELVRPTGSGAADSFLEGTNVGEETSNKFRLMYKVNVVETSDLTETPTYPLSGSGITNHYVNKIVVTPSLTENFLVSAIDITPDVNGADRKIVLDNSAGNIPYSTDADPFIFGKLIDSDGNILTITSIITTDGGATVQMLLDREVDYNSSNPKADLPVITNGVDFQLIKKDHYVTGSDGIPTGVTYFRVADFTFSSGSLTSLTDLRIVTETNPFNEDLNARLIGGGLITWDAGIPQLDWISDLVVTLPGVAGSAVITSSSISTLDADGKVAYVLLDRDASSDYNPSVTVVTKSSVPSNENVYIFAERQDGRIYFPHNGSIGSGETGLLGAFGSAADKDLSLDLIVDSLSENGMDEVFAETFTAISNVDSTNSMTFDLFNRQYTAGSNARFVDYYADTVPASDPDNPWTNLGTQTESASGGILTLTDANIADRIAYTRTESNLTPECQTEHEFRVRLTAVGGTAPNFVYLIKDGASGKHFGISIQSGQADLVDGNLASLITFSLDHSIYHTYKIVKLSNQKVQWYIDDVFRGSYNYSSISTGSGGDSTITWGTTDTATTTADIDYVTFNIYLSILQSVNVFRTSSLFYEGDAIPASSTPAWTKVGGTGISESASGGYLLISDADGSNALSYYRDESTLVRKGDSEIEMRVKINGSLSSFDTFGLRMEDGFKDAAAYIRDDAGQLKVGIYDGSSAILRSTEINIDTDKFVVIKLKKLKDTGYQLFVDGSIQDSIAYEEILDSSSNNRFSFGSFTAAAQYDATIDYLQYSLPGSVGLAVTPVVDFLTIVSTDDPFPKVWVSTDNGLTWYESVAEEKTSITDYDTAGANILVRILLSSINSALTDYGILYNRTGFETTGQFNFDKQVATAGQTVFVLPFAYSPGSNELEVIYRPDATGEARPLVIDEDYTESSATTVNLAFSAAVNDIFTFKNSFVQDPIVPPPVRFVGHNHDGSRGESDVLYPSQIYLGTNQTNVNNLVPIGVMFDHYDFDGLVSIDTNIFAYCDGSVISDAASPLDGETMPDASGRYTVGFGTDGGGDIESATWSASPVGNASHQVNIQHSHTVNSHTHTGPSHTHNVGRWEETSPSGARGPKFFTGTFDSGEAWCYAQTNVIVDNTGVTAFAAGFNAPGISDGEPLVSSAAGTGNTGGATPGTDNQLSTTQSIQPRSIRTRKVLRIK